MVHPRTSIGRIRAGARALRSRPWLVALAILTLLSGVGGALYAASSITATVRLISVDPTPEGSGKATFQVRLSDPIADGEVQIQVRTVAGTATAGSDYTAVDRLLTFVAGGPTSFDVDVLVAQDTTDELNETFEVELIADPAMNTSGDTIIVGARATALIEDDDSPDLTSIVGPAAPVLENTSATFTVNLSAASPQPVSIRWRLVGSGASPATVPAASPPAAGDDLVVASGTWVVPANVASRPFTIGIVNDTLTEPNEQFTLDVTGVTNIANSAFAIGQDKQATIADDDSPPTITTNAGLTVAEGATGTIGEANLEATDPQEGPASLTYTVAAAPANGTLRKGATALAAGGTFTQDDINNSLITYEHNGGNTTSDSFTFRVSDGVRSTNLATFTISVTPVDDPSAAANDSATVQEDAGATAIDVLANDLDPDGGARAITISQAPANGTVQIAGGGLTYTPDANYCNSQLGGTPDTFEYTLTGGAKATVSVTVTCVNDGPVVDANGAATGIDFAATYTEAAGPVAIVAPALTVEDVEENTLSGVVVKIVDAPVNTADLLAVNADMADSRGITPSYNPATATLTLSGAQPTGNYAAVLATLTFDHSSNNPGASRQITVVATDAGTPAASSNPAAVITLTIDEDDEPPTVKTNAGLTVSEGGSANITPVQLAAGDNDTPAAELVFTIEVAPSDGGLQRDGVTLGVGGTFTQADIDAGRMRYVHNGADTGNDGFAFVLSDGTTPLPNTIFVITVTPVNDAPVVTMSAGATGYTAGAPAVAIDTDATVTDIDSADLNGGILRVALSGGAAGDVLAIRNQGTGVGQIGVSGATVSYGGQAIGTVAGGTGGAPLQITFTSAAATPAAAQALLRNITFAGTSTAVVTRTATVTLSDGDGQTSAPASKVIGIAGAPVAADDTLTVAKDAPATPVVVLGNDSDPDGDPLTIVAVTQGAHGTVTITGAGSGLTYRPAAGYSGPDSFTYTVSDGNGGTDSATVTVTVTSAPPPPTAFRVYMPTLQSAQAALPDLQVSFAVSPASPQAGRPASVAVTVTNRGTAPASNFWVDFYINPKERPAVNRPWNELCGLTPCFGMAWIYTGTLQPGQSVTLNSTAQSATNPNGFQGSFSDWRGYFANGTTTLYAVVDSWNRDGGDATRNPSGAVVESNEANNLAEQRISVAPGTLPAGLTDGGPADIPERPAFR